MPKYRVYVIIEAKSRKNARKKFRKEFFETNDHPDHLVNQFFVGELPS